MSEPVVAALNLPPGVSAVGTSRMAGSGLLRLNGAMQADSVSCPGGTGTVTCTNGRGLQPGESVTLLFRIVASEDSQGGTITGTISAGSAVSVSISVRVDVQPPVRKDGVSLYAFQDWLSIPLPGRHRMAGIQTVAKNTGESTKQATVTFDQPAEMLTAWPAATCTSNGATTSCVTSEPLKPGDSFYLRVRLKDRPGGGVDREHPPYWQYSKVLVTASIGTASASTTVKLPWWSWPVPPDPKPTTTTTTPPKTTTPPRSTTKPSVTTTTPPKVTPPKETSTPGKTTDPTTTKPPTTTTTEPRSQTPPSRDYCSSLGPVERLLAVLTGRCPP
ncbi:hypothetical protein DMH04_39500 [Kibdelosporangium aridum]|uniref:Uncharacterized protein n=1 Tax=Kibdelosporangium aridum TaxID=2030 RepID=A0A428YWW3_KIBAR|nr:hypothetical protein [Kibdelosporangium aridum]RSM74549.1 hypothetical protein DMH04_39500 [Kibdelosporangium aridum]